MPTLVLKTDPKLTALPTEDQLWLPDEPLPPKPSLTQRILLGNIILRSHILKLFCLMFLALVHVCYLNPFITSFRAYEALDQQIEENASSIKDQHMVDVAAVWFIMRALVDYKKNLWITVGAMCASLATTAFLLLLAEDHRLNKAAKALVRTVDLCAFIALPCLLAARRLVAGSIIQFGQNALNAAARVVDVNAFQSELVCSIQPRDNVTRCSEVILKSLFPVKIIEYLVILCVLTGVYIALAYLIEYCIRHFFPPSRHDRHLEHTYRNQPLILEA